ELGAVDYILKPYSIPAVLARVSSHLALHGQNQRLEQKYQQKNIELIEKNVQLMKEIFEREQLEITLRKSQEDLRQLNSYIQSVREDEKATIAREIHDELGGILTALKFDTAWVGKNLPEKAQPVIDKVNDMARLVDSSVVTIRRIVTELRPTILDDLGLWAAIEWQLKEFKKRVGIECKIDININCQQFELDKHQSISLFRIIQESLTNVVRHSSATQVEVGARCYTNIVRLWVRDNGIGLGSDTGVHSDSHGIRGMHERIENLGGTIELDSNQGEGTNVNIVLPINQTNSDKNHG
ncbi:MAG: histidine kinase, partial [Chromatiales bacterium]|nr:histidine kinase [Chromatiales bacterium]